MANIRHDVEDVAKYLGDMDASTRKLLEAEAQVTVIQEELAGANATLYYVVNEGAGRCRRTQLTTAPPVGWATTCTFRFGLAGHWLAAGPSPPVQGPSVWCRARSAAAIWWRAVVPCAHLG